MEESYVKSFSDSSGQVFRFNIIQKGIMKFLPEHIWIFLLLLYDRSLFNAGCFIPGGLASSDVNLVAFGVIKSYIHGLGSK